MPSVVKGVTAVGGMETGHLFKKLMSKREPFGMAYLDRVSDVES